MELELDRFNKGAVGAAFVVAAFVAGAAFWESIALPAQRQAPTTRTECFRYVTTVMVWSKPKYDGTDERESAGPSPSDIAAMCAGTN